MTDAPRRLKRGEETELTIEDFADRGKSIARVNGYVVFVDRAVPGERVRVRVIRSRRKYAEARIVDILEPSELRRTPLCEYFGSCGGCNWQHVSYEAQLQAKWRTVRDALTRHGGFGNVKVRPVIGADATYRYRNKMEFSFSANRWLAPHEIATGKPLDHSFALGLHVPGNHYKVLDLSECHLPPEEGEKVLCGMRGFAKRRGWKPWNIRTHEGFLRHLVLRQASRLAECMVNLVTFGHDPDRMAEVAEYLKSEHPAVTTFVNTIHTGVAQTAYGEETHTVFGGGVIHDMIGHYRFVIGPTAFFQTNTYQAERLYLAALEAASLKKSDLAYDLYCGTGTISVFVAPHARSVIGIESVPEAIENAKANALANGMSNLNFVCGDMLKVFTPAFAARHGQPDVVFADPPRAGMHPKVVAALRKIGPERIVYLSCNPRSQARDVALLGDGYEIESVQPVDLFPQTHHVENVLGLRRRIHG